MITLIKSHLTDPYQNLAIEESILARLNSGDKICFLYQNRDSVIIGRHQNPFLETDPNILLKDNIPIVRRLSGGGTVFHDLGNINFSFISFAKDFDKNMNFQIIIETLNEIGVENITRGEKDDLFINGFKISGSSFYNIGEKRLHHGTVLINSDLDNLKKYITPLFDKFDGNYISSRRVKTANISDKLPIFNQNSNDKNQLIPLFLTKIEDTLDRLIKIKEISDVFPFILDFNYIKTVEKYSSFEWNFQKTPKFKYKNIDVNPSQIKSLDEFYKIFSLQ